MNSADLNWEVLYSEAEGGSIDAFHTIVNSSMDGPLLGPEKLNALLDLMENLFERYSDVPIRSVEHDASLFQAANLCLDLHVNESMELYEESRGLLWSWPSAWKFTLLAVFPLLNNPSLGTPVARFQAFSSAIDLLHHFKDAEPHTLRAMFETSGFFDLVSRLWLVEITDAEFSDWAGHTFHATALMSMLLEDAHYHHQVLGFFLDFTAPVSIRRKQVAEATVKFLRDIYSNVPHDLTPVSRNIQIITHLSVHDEPLRHAFLSENCVPIVTKFLVKLSARHPSEITKGVERHGAAIHTALWNLHSMLNFGDGTTWVIQALDTRLLLGLLRCEPWLPYLGGNGEDCFYWFLSDMLPSYAIFHSVLSVMGTSFASIMQSQLHLSRFSDDFVWTDSWEVFVSRLDAQWELLSSVSGLMPRREKCSNPECQRERLRSDLHKCSRCLVAHYCSKACQEADWNPWHKITCSLIRNRRFEGQRQELSADDLEFISVMLDAELQKIKDVIPNIFRERQTKLLVLKLDMHACPTKREIKVPEDVIFCLTHEAFLLPWWDDLRATKFKEPTLAIVAPVRRGQFVEQFIRLAPAGPGIDSRTDIIQEVSHAPSCGCNH